VDCEVHKVAAENRRAIGGDGDAEMAEETDMARLREIAGGKKTADFVVGGDAVRIIARLQYMSSREILNYIEDEKMRAIKREDSTPLFRAYVIGQEGTAKGYLIGVGNVVKRWFQSAIEKLADKLKPGLKLFHQHGDETNEHGGRVEIGEVVGRTIKRIADKVSAVMIAYIKPEFRYIPLDVASIEADTEMTDDGDFDVKEITGIALGNSAVNKPGFPGATLLAQIQAFAKSHVRDGGEGGQMSFTIEEVKEFLKAERVKPSDLFGAETLSEDPVVKGILDTETRRASSGEYAHRKRVQEAFTEKEAEWKKEKEGLEARVKEKEKEILKVKAPAMLEKAATERKLTEQQKKFVQKRLERFSPSTIEKVDEEFAKHLDLELDEFKQTAELLGVKVDEQKRENQDVSGAPAGKELTDEEKYLSPDTNPFILS
jgi:hypothetical protein